MTEKKPRAKALSPLRDWEVFEREMRAIIEQEFRDDTGRVIKPAGMFPSLDVLVRIGRGDLKHAVEAHQGGITQVRLRMGFELTRRPIAIWGDLEAVKRRLLPIIESEIRDAKGRTVKRQGEMPSSQMLRTLGEHGLLKGIQKYHGGILSIAEKLGYQFAAPSYERWQDIELVQQALREIAHRELTDDSGRILKPAGVFPSTRVLIKTRERPLLRGIKEYHGGLKRLRLLMGYPPAPHEPATGKDLESIKRRLLPIIQREIRDGQGNVVKQQGEMPSRKLLMAIGERTLLGRIQARQGGLTALGQRLGCRLTKTPPGTWSDISTVCDALREIAKKEYCDKEGNLIKPAGEFPTAPVLKAIGKSGLLAAIGRYHGGLVSVREAMGFSVLQRRAGYWKDFALVERELRQVIQTGIRDQNGRLVKPAGEFPTGEHLVALGRSSLLAGIGVYHGGLEATRLRLGFPLPTKPRGYWMDAANVERELRATIDMEFRDDGGRVIKERGQFPTQGFLETHGLSSLRHAIAKSGGFARVKRAMGFVPSSNARPPWKAFDDVERELSGVMQEEYRDERGRLIRARGVFPGPTELNARGLGGIVAAMWSYHGGSAAVRARMGIPASEGQREYWAEFGNVERELRGVIAGESADEFGNIIKPAGLFPTYGDLRRIGRHDILRAMQAFHGGYLRVRERMGYSAAVPDAVAEEFLRKLKTIEGAEELVRCPDLGVADKADVLVARHREVFSSTEYVDWVLRSLLDMPSFAPYVETGREVRGAYRTGWGLDVLAEHYPGMFESKDLFSLLVRKMENVFFRRFQAEPQAALERLEAGIRDGGILGEVYAAVDRSLKEIRALTIPGVVSRIRNPRWLPGSELPETIPFPSLHQKRGILRIVEQQRVLIADEMGTGKTAQAILAARLLQARTGRRIRTLVVCPNSVIAWWRDKIHEYCEGIRPQDVIIVSGRGHLSHAMQRVAEGVDFALINYHLLAKRRGAAYPALVGELAGMGFDFVVADEVHNAKNMNANRAEALQRIAERVPFVVLLSGTPIPNRLRDVGMTMALLEPGAYPTARHFTKAFGNNPRLIRDALINGRMLRVRSEDVFALPELTMREVTVDLAPAQRDAYIAVYRDGSIDAYTKMWLLRLLLVDPNAVIRESRGEPLPSPKYDALDRIVEETVAAGRKVVVFTSIKRGVTKELVMRYGRHGVCLIDGDVAAFPRKKKESQRETVRREFQFGDARVLIATLGTMSEGVDLSAASTVVFLDKPFTSTARDQAIKRVHRLGQTKPVEVISIVARDPVIDAVIRDKDTGDHGTIDEAIERLIAKKERLIEHVVDGARLSPEERQLLEEKENLGRVLYSLA